MLDTFALQIDAQGARLDFSALDAEIDRRLAVDPRQDSFRSVLAEEGALVKGIAGFSGAGGNGDDWLVGRAGNDSPTAGMDNDTLRGGTGSDRLIGDSGDDCYVFKRGDGVDTLVDGGPQCNDEKWRIAA